MARWPSCRRWLSCRRGPILYLLALEHDAVFGARAATHRRMASDSNMTKSSSLRSTRVGILPIGIEPGIGGILLSAFNEIDDACFVSGAEFLEHDRDLEAVRRRRRVQDIGYSGLGTGVGHRSPSLN